MLSAVGQKNILRKGQYKSGCSFVLQAHVYIILISSTFIIVYIKSFSRARLILTKKSNCLTSILNKLSQRKILLIREQTLIVTEEQIDNFSYGKNSYRYLSGQRTALVTHILPVLCVCKEMRKKIKTISWKKTHLKLLGNEKNSRIH